MAIDQESFNKRLYDIFKTRGYKPAPKDSKNERTNPETADVFEFQFVKDGEDYGKAWATIDKTSSLNIYYDDNQAGSPPGQTKGVDYDDSWSGLLKHLKQWALSKQLNFGLHDSDRLGDDMRQRDYYKMKEKMNEGYHAVNKTTSYNDNIPNVKVVIQHDRQIGEGEQRWRNVHKIFVENTEGERFAVPTRMPGIARVYGRHVAEGGTPYDDRGKHITQLVEEYTKMAGFVRATRRGEFNESVAKLIHEGVQHHKTLKESLQKMQSHRGYNHYFESWTPALMEDEMDSSNIAEMFAQETIDPRIESVLPILSKLNGNIINEIEEVNELDQWARGITEITEEVIEEEKRDTHCSAKCCGADVKAEDCGCSPDCEHCNCNKKKLDEGKMKDVISDAQDMSREEFEQARPGFDYDEILADYPVDDLVDEGILDKAIGTAAGKIASNPEVQKQISGMASSAGKSAGDAAVSQVNKAIPGAVNTATDQAISNLKGPAIATGAAIAGGAGLAAYGGTKLANKQNKDSEKEMPTEGALTGHKAIYIDATEMSEKEFAKKYPAQAHRYDDILAAFSKENLKDKLSKPKQGELDLTMQGELDLNESYMKHVMLEAIGREELNIEVDKIFNELDREAGGDKSRLRKDIKAMLQDIQDEERASNDSNEKEVLRTKFRLLQKKLRIGIAPTTSALDAANKEAGEKTNTRLRPNPSGQGMKDKVTIGRALSGIIPTLFSEERTDEFMRKDFDDNKPNRPKKGKLVTKDGQEVVLPLRTQDFRGDEMIVTGYKAPHKFGSTGRIYTDDGMSYFPGVADLKIIDHDFSDEIDEALTGNLAGSVAGAKLGGVGGVPGALAGGIIGGIAGDSVQDKIDSFGDDQALKEIKKLANLGSEDDDLADEESGKNHDPKTGKRTKPHPFDTEDEHLKEELIDDEDFSAKSIDKEIKMAYGILNDPRYKGGNMAGAIKAIEGIMPGLSEHPGVKKAIYMTQNEPDNLEEAETKMLSGCTVYSDGSPLSFADWRSETESETGHAMERSAEEQKSNYESYLKRCKRLTLKEIECGGQTFAGKYPCGKDGQWRNTGPTKGKPAKVGDLVGAESKHADDEMSVSMLSDKDLADYVGCSTEYAKANREECEEVANDKSQDHAPDNMLEDILRLSGRTEYTGESTGKGAGTEYKGYGR